MYITATTVLLFIILLAIVDGNEKEANARWEASDECKRLDFEIDLVNSIYGPSEEELQQQKEEEKRRKKEEKKERREALFALPLLVIFLSIIFYFDFVISFIPISILNIFSIIWDATSRIIAIILMFVAPFVILYKWQPAKFWSIHCFCYSLFLLLFSSLIGSIFYLVLFKS